MVSRESPALKLFYSIGACSLVPNIALFEAGLDVELVLTRIGGMSEEFLKLNPKRRVPVLAMGEEIITEMAAVLAAIGSLAPECNLFGKTTLETIRVYEWLNYLSTTAHGQAMAGILRTERFTNDLAAYPSIKEKGRQTLAECCLLINGKLRDARQFAVGNSFTMADCFLVTVHCWAVRQGFDMIQDYPSFDQYAKRLMKKESVIKAREIHKI